PVFLSCDESGRFLLSASYASSTLCVVELDRHGCVSAPPVQRVDSEPKSHSILFAADGASFYTGCIGGRVLKYRFDWRSKQPIIPHPFALSTRAGAGPRHLALHPNSVRSERTRCHYFCLQRGRLPDRRNAGFECCAAWLERRTISGRHPHQFGWKASLCHR